VRQEVARRGDYVEITNVILAAGERAPNVPAETAKVPYLVRQKGFLLADEAVIGAHVSVRTVIGRELEGELLAINPPYQHTFGRPVPELLHVGE
jgi:2-amino-4-ketopentanoate thiolase alpha subunit